MGEGGVSITDEGGIGVMNEGGGMDRGTAWTRGASRMSAQPQGGWHPDKSIHTPFTLFGSMLVIPLLFPTRTVCIYTL